MELYPHQIEALKKTEGFNRCAYYYDMGLGKTFMGSEKMMQLGEKLNLVICQKSKIKDWINHFNKNYPRWHTIDYTSTKEVKFVNMLLEKQLPTILVINYDLVWRRPELLKLADFTLMLDESSLITNRTAKRSKYILKLAPKNVILLSGTPTSGKYEKLWSQLKLLGWNISEDSFWKSYVDYEWVDLNGFWDKKVKGYKNVEHLKKRMAQFGAIFKKTNEVMDLPDQIEQIIHIEPTNEYKKFVKNSYIEIDGKELIGDNVLTKILYQRELCAQYNQEKLDAFRDLVQSTEDRLVVFYNFNDEWHKLESIANELGRPSGVVNGQFKNPEVLEKDSSILFVQYQAGAYGLNLQMANKIIYFSLPLGIGSCDLWEQSKKRIHRIGQDKTCFYYYLLVRNSIEEWNLKLLKTGRDLTDDLFVANRL